MRIRRLSRHAPAWLWAATLGASATPCAAHHSFTIFDFGKSATLAGTVTEFQWNNPHCFIQLLVPKDGATQEWSIEMGSPMQLTRIGWKPRLLRAGDKITIVIHPVRDGGTGGSFMSATTADGKPVGN
jgi:hypothetical protein